MTIQNQQTDKNAPVVVAGGTGNVGGFIVRSLLERGTPVVVPSRSEETIEDLKAYLDDHVEAADRVRLHTFIGNVSDEIQGRQIVQEIIREVGLPKAVISLMGSWRSSDSLVGASVNDLDYVLTHYLKAHFGVAKNFLPVLSESGGSYIFVNGPLAFDAWQRTGLVSVATSAQHMLFKVLAKEHEESPARIAELVTYAFIQGRQTQEGSPISGEAVGAFASHLVSEHAADLHGRSIHLKSPEQLAEVRVETA